MKLFGSVFRRPSQRKILFVVLTSSAIALGAGFTPTAFAQSSPAPAYKYLAFGDSYSSGNGLPRVVSGSGSCARSTVAYPEVVATALSLHPLDFVACSGATIAQVAHQVMAAGPFIARASLVTMSAGGNDLPFTGLTAACIGLVKSVSAPTITYLPSVSSQVLCRAAASSAAKLLGATVDFGTGRVIPSASVLPVVRKPSVIEQRLASLYLSVLNREAAPKSQHSGTELIVVQYPSLLASSGSGNCLLSASAINLPVQTLVNGLFPGFTGGAAKLLIQLNSLLVQETAAVVAMLNQQGYDRISVSPTPAGFVPLDCRNGTSPDLNGLVVAPTSNGISPLSLHPTAIGHSLLAAGVVARWKAMR